MSSPTDDRRAAFCQRLEAAAGFEVVGAGSADDAVSGPPSVTLITRAEPSLSAAAQITDNLKRLKEAGLTMPLLWPPFTDVPVAKTLDDLKRLKEEIMPQVDAM